MSWRERLARKPASPGEETTEPGDLRSALALYREGRLRPFRLYKRLTGPRQAWWEYCQATARGTAGFLGEEELSEVFTVIDREEPPQSPGAVTSAARAVHAVSHALAAERDEDQQGLLSEAAGHWRNGPAAPVPAAGAPFPVDTATAQVPLRLQDRTRSVLSLLGNVRHDQGEAMAAICALLLAGAAPEARSAVQVRVVLAVREQEQINGVTGRLDVHVLPGGPAGLYPDPRTLTVQPADAAFNRALHLAWQFAGGDSQSSCVLWRLTPDADVPGYGIDGSSLGASFAISLQQLLQHRPASRLLSLATLRGSLTRLRPTCVITGELSGQRPAGYPRQALQRGPWLASVGQMDAKLKAVSTRHLRLVAPTANKPASPAQIPPDVAVYWASTLRQADRYARRVRPVRTAAAGLALIVLVGGSVGPALAAHYDSAAGQQHQAAVSAQLASTANRLRDTDPAVAAQLDVAAYDAAASGNGYTAMLNDEAAPLETAVSAQASTFALSPDGALLATVPATGPVSLRETAVPGRAAVSLSGTGVHGGTSADPVGFSPDGRMLAAPDPAGGISLWDVYSSSRAAKSSPDFGSSVTSVGFSPDGNILAVGIQQGTVQLWNIADPGRPAPLGKPAPASGSSSGAVTALMFNSTGQSLYSGTLNGTIDVWTMAASGRLTLASQPVPGAQGQQDQVTFSNRGQAVMTDESGDTFLYNLTSHVSPQAVTGGPAVISPSGLTIAARDQNGNITLLNTTQPLNYPLGTQLPVKTPTAEGDQSPGPMSFDANGTMLAAGDYGTIMLWHLPAGYQPDSALPLAAQLDPDSIDGNAAAVADENDAFVQQLSGGIPVTYHVNGTTSGLAEAIPALGDDGHLLALGEKNSSVSLWSLQNGKALLLDPSFSADVTSLSLSASGKILAVAASNSTVSLWNLADPADPTFVASLDSGGPIAISPDGGTLAVLDADHLQLWDVSDPGHWSAIGSGFSLGIGSSGVTALGLSPGGKMLGVATTAGTVRLWNLSSAPADYGQPLTSNYDSDYNYLQTRVDSVGVNALAFSADGTTLTSVNADSTIRIWNLRPATVIRNICGATAGALTAAVWNQYLSGEPYQSPCPDDATAAGQGTATAAPAASGANSGQAGLCTARQLALSSHATTSDDSGVTEYILVLILTNRSRSSCSLTGVPSVSLDGPPDPPLSGTYQLVSNALPGQAAVALAPGAQAHVNLTYLPATGSTGGGTWVPKTVKMTLPGTNGTLTMPWSLGIAVVRQDMASDKGTFTGPFLAGSGLAASPTSPAPASSSASAAASLKVNTCARGTSSAASAPAKVGSITTGAAENDFVDVAFSPDCQIAAAGGNGIVQIRNMVTGTSIATLSAASGSAVDIDAFTPDGKALAVAGGNGYTTLWDAATGNLEARFPSDPSGGTYCLVVSPDSSEIFTGGSTGNVGIWSVTTHQSLGTITTDNAVGAMALSPNGQLLAVAGYDETIRIYNTTSRALAASLPSDDGHIWSMAFSPDGSTLAVGSNVIQWWSVASHELITRAISPGGSVTDVAFNPDGTILAAGGYKMVGLWNTSTHQLTTTLNLGPTAPTASANASYPNGMAFSRYGAILAVGWYGTLEFWNVAR